MAYKKTKKKKDEELTDYERAIKRHNEAYFNTVAPPDVQKLDPAFDLKSQTSNYTWETDLLKPLSIKSYGRSYNDKFDTFTKRAGISPTGGQEFRRWLDAGEKMETNNKYTSETLRETVKKEKQEKLKKQQDEEAKARREIANGILRTINPTAVDKVKNFFTSKDTNGDGNRDGLLGALDRYVLPISQGATEFLAPGNNERMIQNDILKHGEVTNPVNKASLVDRGTETKVLRGAGTLLAALAPYGEAYKAADYGFNKLPKLARAVTNPYAQKSIKGAVAGGMAEAGLSAENEIFNSEANDIKDYAIRTGLGVAGGAILDPALYGVGQGIRKGLETTTSRAMESILPDKKEAAKRLSELIKSYHQEQAPLPGKPDPRGVDNLLPSGNDITNPNFVPKLNSQIKSEVTAPKFGPSLEEALANPRPNVPEVPNLTEPQAPKTNETLKVQPLLNQQVVPEQAPLVAPKQSKTIAQPIALRTIKTKKDVNVMSKDELQSVYKQLRNEHKNLSKAKGSVSEQRLIEVQNDMEQVQGLLMRLDLQLFGEGAPIADLPDTRSHIGSKTEKNTINIKNTADKAYIKTVDNLHRLNQFDHTVEKVIGRELKPSESTHTLGLNSRGSDMISKQILTQNMVDKSGEVVGKSLKEITMKVPKNKLKDFEDYLVNQHAITRMERGEKVFPDSMEMTTDKSKAIVKNYEATHPEFKEISKEYYEYNKQLGQKWLVDTGILSKDQWEGYLKANPNYVPNNRIFSDIERPLFYGSKKGFANQTNPVKKAVGSQRKIVSPIESTIEHTAQYIKTAKRNEVMQTLINNIKQNPEAFKDWAEIMPTEKGAGTVLDSISNKLDEEGINGVLEEFNKVFDQKPDLSKGNVVRGLIDGKPVHVKVHDPYLLDAITNLTPQAQNIVIHSLGQVTRVMKNLTTGINPVFSLTRNIWRDIPTAFANSKTTNNPLVFSKDLIQSVISVFKNDELYRSFKAIGGGHSSPISSDINLLAQSKRAILPQKGVKPLLGKLLGGLENLNNAVEAAPRLGEFKRLAGSDYDSKMKALFEANDVTVNFNKYGNVTKEVDAVIPYLNAAVQGLDKTWRALISPRTTVAQKTVAGVKAFTAVTIPSMALFALNHDNPDYKKLSNYIKDTNFLIPKGDGTFFKIPKSRELGALFGTDVERLLKAWVDKDPKAFNEFGTYMLEMFAPPTRSIAAPLSDLRSNKNFMDAPIVPGDLEGLTPRYQYDSQTSEVSKKIGNLTNTSPKQLDYLFKSYSGIIGELGIPATTKNSSVGQTLVQKVTADPVFSNDIQREFYDTKTKLDQAHNDLAKQGVKSKNLNEQLRKTFSKKSLEMGKVRKQMKEVQKDSSLSSKERLKQLRELQEQINQIAESGNELAR